MAYGFNNSNKNLMNANDSSMTSQIVQGVNNTANLQKSDVKSGVNNPNNGIDMKMIIIGIVVIMLLKKAV